MSKKTQLPNRDLNELLEEEEKRHSGMATNQNYKAERVNPRTSLTIAEASHRRKMQREQLQQTKRMENQTNNMNDRDPGKPLERNESNGNAKMLSVNNNVGLDGLMGEGANRAAAAPPLGAGGSQVTAPGAYRHYPGGVDVDEDDDDDDDDDEEIGSSPSPSPSPMLRQGVTPDGESYVVTNVVATAVPNEEDIVTAESVQVEGFFHNKRRAMSIMGLLLVLVLVLAVSLGVSLSGDSDGGAEDPKELGFAVAADPIDGELNSRFGSSVSLCGDSTRMAVAGPGTGIVQVFDLPKEGEGGTPTQVGSDLKYDISVVTGSSKFVRSPIVVDLSADCEVLAVGLPYHDNNSGQAQRPGRVELYEYNAEEAKWEPLGVPNSIVGETATGDDLAGASISLSRDGGLVAVGSPGHDMNGQESGQVRVFQLLQKDQGWKRVGQSLHGAAAGGAFGGSVWLSSRLGSNVLAVGSSTGTGEQATTAARVFKLQTGEWNPQGNGVSPDAEALAGIETSWLVRLSLDGSKLVISNVYLDQQGQVAVVNENTGLYVAAFEFSASGGWTQLGNNIHRNVEGAKSGYTITLSEDGNRIGMGDPGSSALGGELAGHAHIFEYQADSDQWCQRGEDIMGSAAGDLAGFDVSISEQGRRIVMGSPANRDLGRERGRIWIWDLEEDAVITSCNE